MAAPPPDDPEPFPPFELLGSERIYDSPWCGLRRDLLRLDDGSAQEYHVFEIADAVCVVPFTGEDRLVMVGQYRHPHGRTHWELPAGRIGPDELPEEAARRELREETGHACGRLLPLPGFYPTNGISAHYAHLFLALDCSQAGAPNPDRSERLSVATFSLEEALALLDAGRLQDGFTALGLLQALRWREGG
jgi:ADP-ribose pyrophosphatase